MKSKGKPYIREVTPAKYACIIGPCPAIFETENEYLIVGRQVPREEMNEAVENKVGPQETVVAVPKGIIRKIAVGR